MRGDTGERWRRALALGENGRWVLLGVGVGVAKLKKRKTERNCWVGRGREKNNKRREGAERGIGAMKGGEVVFECALTCLVGVGQGGLG